MDMWNIYIFSGSSFYFVSDERSFLRSFVVVVVIVVLIEVEVEIGAVFKV